MPGGVVMSAIKDTYSVIAVDDSQINLNILTEILNTDTFEVTPYSDAKSAFEAAKQSPPDIFLLDVNMPDINGHELCSMIKNHQLLKDTPIIFLSAMNDSENILKCFEIGGADYVIKPVQPEELKARLMTHIKLREYQIEIEKKNSILETTLEELQEMMKTLETMSRTDSLTNILNRRGFMEVLLKEISRVKRRNRCFSLILCDIDFFKNVNDSYGHECGDQTLINITKTLRTSLREQDEIARWGGEEFLIMVVETNYEEAKIVAEHIRKKIENMTHTYKGKSFSVTMTFGFTEFDTDSDIDVNITNADKALYKGKQACKNCIVGSKEL